MLPGVVLALSACGISFLPQGQQSARGTANSTAAAPQPDVAASAELPARSQYEGSVQQHLSCPDGRADIGGTISVVELSEDCGTVTVEGQGVVVLTQHVDKLEVKGALNVVVATSLGAVNVDGQGNVITWEKGNPKTQQSGIMNVFAPSN